MINLVIVNKNNFFNSYSSALKFFDFKFFNFFVKDIIELIVPNMFTVGLPKTQKNFRVIRSPHVNKKSMEHFKINWSKYMFGFISSKIFNSLNVVFNYVIYIFKYYSHNDGKKKGDIIKIWFRNDLVKRSEVKFYNDVVGLTSFMGFSALSPDDASTLIFMGILIIFILLVFYVQKKRKALPVASLFGFPSWLAWLDEPIFRWPWQKKPDTSNRLPKSHPDYEPPEAPIIKVLREGGYLKTDEERNIVLKEGELQEIYAIEEDVRNKFALLSEDEKEEFMAYLKKEEYGYREFPDFRWTDYYDAETGKLLNMDYLEDPVWYCMNCVITWKQNTLNYFLEHDRRFPWTDDIAAYNAMYEATRLKFPEKAWFNEFFWYLVTGPVKYDLNKYYVQRSIQKYAQITDWKDLVENYHLAFDKMFYKTFLKPKPLKNLEIPLDDIKSWISYYDPRLNNYLTATNGTKQSNHNSELSDDEWLEIQKGGYFKRQIHDIYHFDKFWFNTWNPTANHPYNTRVLGEKKLWYIQAVDHWNNDEPVMLAFKGNTWVEVVSVPQYIARIRHENDLVHERETILEEVSTFYEQYTFKEYFQRQVQWLEEYSAILHTFGVKEKFITGDVYYRYHSTYGNARLTWANGDLLWDPYCDGGRLSDYYFSKLDNLHHIYEWYTWWPILKLSSYFTIIYVIDFILRTDPLRHFTFAHKYKIFRAAARTEVYKMTRMALVYSHDLTIFIYIISYIAVFGGVFKFVLPWRAIRDGYLSYLSFKKKDTAVVYNTETKMLTAVNLRESNGSYGFFTELQIKMILVWRDFGYSYDRFKIVLNVLGERLWLSLENRTFAPYLHTWLGKEYGYLEKIVRNIVLFPKNAWNYSLLFIEKSYNFMFLIPGLIRKIPELIALIILSVVNMLEDMVLFFEALIDNIISELLLFWLFLVHTLIDWFKLLIAYDYLYYNYFVYIIYYYNTAGWWRKSDWHHMWYDFNFHILAIKWLRHKDRYRPEEHFSYNDTTDTISWAKHKLNYINLDAVPSLWLEYKVERFIFDCRIKIDHFLEFLNAGPFKEFSITDYRSFRICFLHHFYFYEHIIWYHAHKWIEVNLEWFLQAWGQRHSWLFYIDFWLYNSVWSVIFYPFIYIWRHTVGQAYASLKFVFYLWWEKPYFNWRNKAFNENRMDRIHKVWRKDFFAYFKELLVSGYELICSIMSAIFYPVIAIKWYIGQSSSAFFEFINSTFVSVVYYFDLSNYSKYIETNLREFFDIPIVHDEPKKLKRRSVVDFYYELGDENIAEHKYPLTADQKLLDKVGLFDRRERNLIILKHSGFEKEVEFVRKVVEDKKKLVALKSQINPEPLNYTPILKDRFIDWPFRYIHLIDTFKDFMNPYIRNYYRPIKNFFVDVDIFNDGIPFLLNLHNLIPLWIKKLVDLKRRCYNTLINLTLEIYDNFTTLLVCTKTFRRYLEFWYFIKWENLDRRLFIDIFYYWLYDVPEDYYCERYTKTWTRTDWFEGERYAILRKIHNAGDGKLYRDTRTWGYYHQNHWEKKAYFEGSSLEFLSILVKEVFKDIKTWRESYIEQKFVFNYPRFYNKFGNRKYVATWVHKYDQDAVDPIPFKGDELIEYYLLRTKYSIYFYIRSIFDLVDFTVSVISLELWRAAKGVVFLPLRAYQFLNVVKVSNASLKSNINIVINNFHYNFSNRYIFPVIAMVNNIIHNCEAFLLSVGKGLVTWYSIPLVNLFDIEFKESDGFWNFLRYVWNKITSKDSYIDLFYMLKDHPLEAYNITVYIIIRTWDGLKYCYDVVMYKTTNIFLLLKEKILPYCEPYLQEFHSRVEQIRGLYYKVGENASNIGISYNNLVNDYSFSNMVSVITSGFKFIISILTSVGEMFTLFFIWTGFDFCLACWNIIKSIPKLIYNLFELYIFSKFSYNHFLEESFYYGGKLFKMFYLLYKALYNTVFEVVAAIIEYFATLIAWVLDEVFAIDFYATILAYYIYGPYLLIGYFFNSVFYLFDCIISFNINHFFIRCNMLFTDFWQYISIGEYWWDNIMLAKMYSVVMPTIDWLGHNFSTVRRPTEISEKWLLRGDFNRRLPFLIGEDQDKLSAVDKIHLKNSFDSVGKEMWFPLQNHDLWLTHTHITEYIKMLERTKLPFAVKKRMFVRFLDNLHWESIYVLHNKKGMSRRFITRYFQYVVENNHFGASWVDFSTMDKMTKYTKVRKVKQAVIDRWMVHDRFFVDWGRAEVEQVWASPTLFNSLDNADIYWLRQKVKDTVDLYVDDTIWNEGALMRKKNFDTIIDYELQYQEASDTYDFMAFNQKIYNFYLDMFGPEFAYIYYHFPGTSLQLNDKRLSYDERVEWLSNFVYTTKSRVLSNISMVNRLNDLDFKNYMTGAEMWSHLNMFQKHGFVETRTDWFTDVVFWGRPYFDGGKKHDKIYNLQSFAAYYLDIIFGDDDIDNEYIEPYYGVLDESVLGPDDSWLTWWDEVDKQFGWKFGWKVPYEWFYELPYFDFKNNFLFQKDVKWLNWSTYDPDNRFRESDSRYNACKYHRNYFGYGEDWEIGGLSFRDRIVALELQDSIVARTWAECFNDTLLVTRDLYYMYSSKGVRMFKFREPQQALVGPPNIDMLDYNRVLRERMHNKPSCYDYWVFYEKGDSVASSLNNFENLNVLNNNVFYDAPSDWQYGFQDPASPIMEGIIDLHHDLCFFLILVSIFVSWILFNVIYYFNTTNYNLKIRIKKWFQEEVRETLIDLVYVWYGLTTRVVEYANNNKGNALANLLAKNAYNVTMLLVYWENVYFSKWFHDKEIENLVTNARIQEESILPQEFIDILSYINKNGYSNVEYFYNEVEGKGYFVSKDNEDLYNEFKNNPNVVSHTVKLNTILKSLVAIRGLQLELSNKQFENGVVESKEYLNEVITGNEGYFDFFEDDFEETELKEEFVWFPQLFTHNTTIEIVWTIIPAIILVFIAIPSFSLLYAMDQIWQPLFTIKVLGNQWYWSYEYC